MNFEQAKKTHTRVTALDDLCIMTLNAGHKKGALKFIEVTVGRFLQRILCFLHMLELPGRNLFWGLDGGTSGPVCTY